MSFSQASIFLSEINCVNLIRALGLRKQEKLRIRCSRLTIMKDVVGLRMDHTERRYVPSKNSVP